MFLTLFAEVLKFFILNGVVMQNLLYKSVGFFKLVLIGCLGFLLISCGPPEYKNLTLLKNYSDDMKYTKAVAGKDGAPALEDIEGERFYNLFILRADRTGYTFPNKTYQFRATISQNPDSTFKIKTSPINFSDSMPIQPIFEFSQVDLVKLENGAYSFVAKKPGTGVFRTVATQTNPEGFVAVRYDDIKLIYAGTEIKVVKDDAGKKTTMVKFSLDFKQDITEMKNGWLNVQEVVTNSTKGFENATYDEIYQFNTQNKNLILAARQMASSMKGAAGTHCDYRIEFQGYRLKYTGIKTRPYLFNKEESKYKRLPRVKVCDSYTILHGTFLDPDYKGVADVVVSVLDPTTNQPIDLQNSKDASNTQIKTDKDGKFVISSKDYKNFTGGFLKLKFEYKQGGAIKTSYYPSETDVTKKSTVFKMTPNSEVRNLIAQIPDTSIRVKPLAGGLGITGYHDIYLYKDSPQDKNPIKLTLERKPAIEGRDRANSYQDYTATFKNLSPGKYYLKMHAKGIDKDFWYTGTDSIGNVNIFKQPNTPQDAAEINLEKDQKLKIYPTFDVSLVTQAKSTFDYWRLQELNKLKGASYQFDEQLLDEDDNIVYATGGSYRNLLVDTKYKIRVRRRTCTDGHYVSNTWGGQSFTYFNCGDWGNFQWVKESLVFGNNYKIKMTNDKNKSKIHKLDFIEPNSISTPERPLGGIGSGSSYHLMVYDFDELLDK